MNEVVVSTFFIAGLFFVVAFVYSSVGMGGGSSYTALMSILGFEVLAIPLISLMLNLFVSTMGSINFIRNRHVKWKLILPFLVTSIPMAYIGGALHLPKTVFYWVLLVSLCFVAVRIYFWKDTRLQLELGPRRKLIISLLAGSVLGLIAGIVGIGGGIYLVPLIIILGLGSEKEAAACGVIFICLNSISGLAARLQFNAIDISNYIPLIIAVVIGGYLGSHLGSTRFAPRTMEKILGVIILFAILSLGKKVLTP